MTRSLGKPRDHSMAFALFLIVSILVMLGVIKLVSDHLIERIQTFDVRCEIRTMENRDLIEDLQAKDAALDEAIALLAAQLFEATNQ